MRLFKRLFYTIALLIMAGCVFILVCALNPSLTEALASSLSQESTVLPEDGGTAEISGVVVSGETDPEVVGSEEQAVDGTNTGEPVQMGYIAPSEEAVAQPEQVRGRTGYEPVQGEEEQVADTEAESLQDSLSMGAVGEGLTFDTEIYPYYGMLDQELQQLYRQIYANALELRTSFAPVITVGINRVKDVFEAVYNDHPELFWLETEYSCKYNQKGICLEITLQYNDTAEDLDVSRQLFEDTAQAIVSEAAKQESDYDKELFIHDTLVKRVDYDTDADRNQSAYSALIDGRSVCAGYSRAFQYLLQQLGIPCYYCTGYSGADHAWNIVKLDDKYVNVDVTWDDTTPSTYDYFNKTDIDFAGTHVRKSLSVYLPACASAAPAASMSAETVAKDLEGYVNDDPQVPLSYPSGAMVTEQDKELEANLQKAGITEDEVMDTMQEYYADCQTQMVEVGTGQQYFSNVIPKSLWSSVEQAYSSGAYENGYVKESLKQLKKDYFAVQLQLEDIGGGYYRIYHNIVTW